MQPSAGYRQTRIAGLALALVLAILTGCFPLVTPPPPQSPSAIPSFSLPSGYYEHDIQVTLSPPQAEAQLFFTLDGSLPDSATGTPYTQPLQFNADRPAVVVLRARALLPGDQWSPVATATYFVNISASLPLLSLVMDPDDLWDPQLGIYVNPLTRGADWEYPVDLTYVDEERSMGFQVPAGIRIHGNKSRELKKKAFRLYFRQAYGAGKLDYPLFPDSLVQSFDCLILHNGGQDWASYQRDNWTLLRNALLDSLAFELNGYATHSRPVLLFINGQPWGIYYLRERADEDYLHNYCNIDSADYLEDPAHPVTRQTLMGDRENWDTLITYLESNDLSNPEAYTYVKSQVNIENFFDYNLLQIYAGNIDWPARNIQQFRPRVQGGRWHWIFWDSDHAFAAEPHGEIDDNLIAWFLAYEDHVDDGETDGEAEEDEALEIEGRDTLLLRKLLENPEARNQFINRAADLLNTTLAPEALIARIDMLAGRIAPDISYEVLRWKSYNDWEANVEELRTFARLRPAIFRQQIIDGFGLGGTIPLTVHAATVGQGTVAVNSLLVETLPWEGIYFQGVPIQITAAPAPGYRFAGWDNPNLANDPTLKLTLTTGIYLSPRFEPLEAIAPHPGDLTFTGMEQRGERSWFELRVQRPDGVDIRGWRVTDNDTKTATDEGSLIFTDLPDLANLPKGTVIRVVIEPRPNTPDLIQPAARRVILYTGNGALNGSRDPGFVIGEEEALVLLAPGLSEAFDDDQGIAFWGKGTAVTPASFGILSDGVW